MKTPILLFHSTRYGAVDNVVGILSVLEQRLSNTIRMHQAFKYDIDLDNRKTKRMTILNYPLILKSRDWGLPQRSIDS